MTREGHVKLSVYLAKSKTFLISCDLMEHYQKFYISLSTFLSGLIGTHLHTVYKYI